MRLRFLLGGTVVLLRGAVLLLGLFDDPGVSHVGDFCHQKQIVASEARGILPVLPFRLVKSGQGDIVPNPAIRLVGPNRGLNARNADFVNGLGLFCLRHNNLSFIG